MRTTKPPSRSGRPLTELRLALLRPLIVAAITLSALATAAPAAARALPTEENSAACIQMSGWTDRELRVTLNCSNAGEGEIYVIYPDGARRTLVAYRTFWEMNTGSPVLYGETGVIALTQSGRYSVVLEGKGVGEYVNGAFEIIDVAFRKSWELTATGRSTPAPEPTPEPERTPTPETTPAPAATPKPERTPIVVETPPSSAASLAPVAVVDSTIATPSVVTTDPQPPAAVAAIGATVDEIGVRIDGELQAVGQVIAATATAVVVGLLLLLVFLRRRRA